MPRFVSNLYVLLSWPIATRVGGVVGIDTDRRLIYDSSRKHALILTLSNLESCGFDFTLSFPFTHSLNVFNPPGVMSRDGDHDYEGSLSLSYLSLFPSLSPTHIFSSIPSGVMSRYGDRDDEGSLSLSLLSLSISLSLFCFVSPSLSLCPSLSPTHLMSSIHQESCQEAGGRRQEAGGRRQEAGGGRQG
jgi:hypothetical protein